MKTRRLGPDDPPAPRRSVLTVLLRGTLCGTMGAVAGAACWLTLFIWDSVEDGVLAWPGHESLQPLAGFILVLGAPMVLIGLLLGVLPRRRAS
jgi:hypothetical protein